VLKLSTMWQFQAIRGEAIAALSRMDLDPVDKLILAHKHEVQDWIIPSLNQIAQRSASLQIADALRLEPLVGLDYILKIGEVRESFVPNTIRTWSYTCNRCNRLHGPPGPPPKDITPVKDRQTYDFTNKIRATFKL
jgi:hypothetical protein